MQLCTTYLDLGNQIAIFKIPCIEIQCFFCKISNDISYIPEHRYLFSADIEQQIYVSKRMPSNMEGRKHFSRSRGQKNQGILCNIGKTC